MSIPTHPLTGVPPVAAPTGVADLGAHRRRRELEGAVETLRLLVRAIGRANLVEGVRAGDLAGVVVGCDSVVDLGPTAVARLLTARQDVSQMFDEHLDPEERDVLTARFGLVEGVAHTQTAVGALMRLSVPEVAEIEARALSRLRHPAFADVLEACLDG